AQDHLVVVADVEHLRKHLSVHSEARVMLDEKSAEPTSRARPGFLSKPLAASAQSVPVMLAA
ncbi:hypothetical protein, partial [Kitasatospora aureofaciens]|uniref:hypothetical protein n=1 Tax=Kitasatospora aureofaciens TaxID=1894 RepID=UPI0033F4DC3F